MARSRRKARKLIAVIVLAVSLIAFSAFGPVESRWMYAVLLVSGAVLGQFLSKFWHAYFDEPREEADRA